MAKGPNNSAAIGAGLSDHDDAVTAAEMACDRALEALHADGNESDPDFVLAFASQHHAQLMGAVGDVLHRRLDPGALLAVSAEAVIGGETELEGRPGISVLAARTPGARVRVFTSEDLPVLDEDDATAGEQLAGALKVDESLRAIVLFADPFSVPMVRLLPALSTMCRDTLGLKNAPIVGGMASAGGSPGSNGLVIDKRLSRTGAIGAVISGDLGVDFVVSQGCRPVGQPWVVTEARRNILFQLGGRKAMEVVQETVEGLSLEERQLLEKGLFLGRVINEYKPRFGRGDFLIRNVIGVDQDRGALAVADILRVGQTVQFHLRDARTADEDLSLLLSAQALHGPALGAMTVTCNSRGTRLFPNPHHDAKAVSAALRGQAADAGDAESEGEPSSGGGGAMAPLAGFFAAGEIGPVGGQAFLHAHTASIAIFRPHPSIDLST